MASFTTETTATFILIKKDIQGLHYQNNKLGIELILQENKNSFGSSRKPQYYLKQIFSNGGLVHISGLFALSKDRTFSGDFYNSKEMNKTRFKLVLSSELTTLTIIPESRSNHA